MMEARLLLGLDALSFLEGKGFSILRTEFARDADEAVQAAWRLGFPVTLKVSSPDVLHKTELGGVKAKLRGEEEVREGFREIAEAFRARRPEGRFEGVLVQEQGDGVEVIVGTLLDGQFGPVLMFGLGGIFAEVLEDVTFRIIPIERKDARQMIRELKGYPLLAGARGIQVDLERLEDFLLKVSRLIEDNPQILEMDLNPVFLSRGEPLICDARMKMGGPQKAAP